MKKFISKNVWLIIFFLLCAEVAFCQSIVPRSNSSITVQDSRYSAQYNLFVPRYADTTAANVQKGIDTLGAIIYTYDVQNFWVRRYSSGVKWEAVGSGSGGSGTVTNIATGLGLSGGPITTTGTILVDTASASILSRQRADATYQPIGSYVTGNIYTVDGTLTETRNFDLNDFTLNIRQPAISLLFIDPTADNEITYLRAGNITGGDNTGGVTFATTDLNSSATFRAEFNALATEATILAFADTDSATIDYTADRHRIIGDLRLVSLAGNGSGVVAVDNDGDLSWTAASGTTIYTGDGTLSGDRTVALNSNFLKVSQGSNSWLTLDPDFGVTNLQSIDPTNNDNVAGIFNTAEPTTAIVELISSFNGGAEISSITATTVSGSSSIAYLADQHTITGAVRLVALAGSGSGFIAVDNDGDLSFSSGSGANTALSNLAAVAINTSLVSDADNTDDIGSSLNSWKDVYSRTLKLDGSTSGTVTIASDALSNSIRGTTLTGEGVVMSGTISMTQTPFALQDVNTDQPYLDAAQDTWTLQANTLYEFETIIDISSGTASHSLAFGITLGGGASINFIKCVGYTHTAAINANTATFRVIAIDRVASTVLNAAGAVARQFSFIKGYVSVNAGGTFQPFITFSAAPGGANQTNEGTYFKFTPVGINSTTIIGPIN